MTRLITTLDRLMRFEQIDAIRFVDELPHGFDMRMAQQIIKTR